MPPLRFITLQDVADRARVSRTTASLALRNHPKISLPVRERIRVLAESMGYRPNPLLSVHMASLRSTHPAYRAQSIAFLCNRSLKEVNADRKTPLRQLLHGATQRANELGYGLDYFNLAEPGMTGHRLSQILLTRGIRGVIVGPLSEGAAVASVDLEWENFAAAAIDRTLIEPRLHKVSHDQFATVNRLIQRLLDGGHERVGIAMHQQMDLRASHYWLAGYQAFQALTKAGRRIPHFITREWSEPEFLRWYRRWKPDAIITINDDIWHWLRAAGVSVPSEVSCASLYWTEDRPHLSGYDQNRPLIAASAIDLVAGQLTHNERGIPAYEKTVLIQAVWKEGTTVSRRATADFRASLRILEEVGGTDLDVAAV